MDPPLNLSIDYLNLLPDELLLEILLKTDDLKTLSGLCRTSKRINNICQDEFFWHRKYQKNFGFSSRGSRGLSDGNVTLVKGNTWKERYKQMFLPEINSPISIKCGGYGIIDQKGNLYMTGEEEILGIGIQPQGLLGVISKKQHLVKFPSNDRNSSLSNPYNPQPKVISISGEFFKVAAVTADGKAYVWGRDVFGSNNLICSPRELTLPSRSDGVLSTTGAELPGKAIRIEIGKLGYIVLLEDSTVYIHMFIRDGEINFLHIMNLKIIDISIVNSIYTIITKDHKLYIGAYMGNGYTTWKKFVDLTLLVFPERVKRVSINDFRLMVLSVTGNVYTQDFNDYAYMGAMFGEMNPKLIKLPEPIVQISSSKFRYAALSETGKLYMWEFTDAQVESSKPVEISLGSPINFVSVGTDTILAVSNDGSVIYWGNSRLSPE